MSVLKFFILAQFFKLNASFMGYASHKRWTMSTSSTTSTITPSELEISSILKDDFPILFNEAYPGKKLVYLDSAASSQKPNFVLKKMDDYYKTSHSNVHRGAHSLAIKATTQYEWARDQIKTFINARQREEIIFTRGASEAINIVALSYTNILKPGDEIILSVMEHHSNLVPWQMAAQKSGAILKFVNITDNMEFDFDHYLSLLNEKTKIVALSHSSNVLGNINPIKNIINAAHLVNAKVLIDACQSVPHMPVDVQTLDMDFLVASGHKMCGPTGIGFLYGKLSHLKAMDPVYGGGEMINRVDLYSSTYAEPPSKFEAGTPAIAEAVGLGAACDYLMTQTNMKQVFYHDLILSHYLYEELSKIPGLTLYGPKPKYSSTELTQLLSASTSTSSDTSTTTTTSIATESLTSSPTPSISHDLNKINLEELEKFTQSTLPYTHGLRTGLVAFNCETVHPTDLSFFMDQEGVALRTGHHCTQPLHRQLNIPASIRASVYFYNDKSDIDVFIQKLKETINMFQSMNPVL